MEEVSEIPEILIYEEFDGHPIYRKGYKDFVSGLKKIEEINTGANMLQWGIITSAIKHLTHILPQNYFAGAGSLGLDLGNDTKLIADIAIYQRAQIKTAFYSTQYATTPPIVVIEVDIRVDEEDYFHKKAERLLEWGVERVIWVFSSSQRILIADNLQEWRFIRWDLPFTVIDDYEVNLWDLMLEDGFEA